MQDLPWMKTSAQESNNEPKGGLPEDSNQSLAPQGDEPSYTSADDRGTGSDTFDDRFNAVYDQPGSGSATFDDRFNAVYDQPTTYGTNPSEMWSSAADINGSSRSSGAETPAGIAGVGFEPNMEPPSGNIVEDAQQSFVPDETNNQVFNQYGGGPYGGGSYGGGFGYRKPPRHSRFKKGRSGDSFQSAIVSGNSAQFWLAFNEAISCDREMGITTGKLPTL